MRWTEWVRRFWHSGCGVYAKKKKKVSFVKKKIKVTMEQTHFKIYLFLFP